MTVGERIKKIRLNRDMTMEQFGEKIGVSKSTISNIENGNRNATTHMIKSICREFNVTENWLRTGEDDISLNQEGDFFLDDLVRQKGGTEEDLALVKAYFDLPAEVRKILLTHFKERLLNNSEMSRHDYSDIPDRPDTANDENTENSAG